MKRLAATLCASIVFAMTAAAETPEPVSRFTRPDSGLRLTERSDSHAKGSFAIWTGRIALTGKLILEFDRGQTVEPNQDVEGFAFFEPDDRSQRRLPRAVGNFYPLEPKVISLGIGPKEILSPLIGSARTNAILAGSEPRYEVPVRVVIRQLRTDVECDHRSYGAELASISTVVNEVMAMGQAKDFGC